MEVMDGLEALDYIAKHGSISNLQFKGIHGFWVDCNNCPPDEWCLSYFFNNKFKFRVKEIRIVNGFEVSAPLSEMPHEDETYYLAGPIFNDWYCSYVNSNSQSDKRYFERKLMFSSKEDAIANAKAMCGIDPKSN